MANRLINETSPYLLQHAHNPVDWYPWGEEAFAKARAEDKPVLVSIGYAACHWCHVMERESFEDPETAAKMNELLVSIKVDREERPDIDSIYMQAVMAIHGHGGWPLNVFLTPDGHPFYGGTYFPKRDRAGIPSWTRVVETVAQAYRTRRDEVLKGAELLTQSLEGAYALVRERADLHPEVLRQAYLYIEQYFDEEHGGFGNAPKFPNSMVLEFLLRYHARTGEERALHMVEHSLAKMANGGIYDHLGGGFARYSTDAYWLVPHFEKMLYDNALLASAYLQAFQVTGDESYARVLYETLGFLERDCLHPDGGFFSSWDADSEGEEGKFYVWTPSEIEAVLGKDDARLFNRYYGVTRTGNFEGRNVLHVPDSVEAAARDLGMSGAELRERLLHLRTKMLAARAQRVPPGRDEKVLTGWNALALRAFAEAGAVMEDDHLMEVARDNAEFLLREMRPDGRLLRTWKDGRAHLKGYLEDYALLANALLSLHAATFEHRWLHAARELVDEMLQLFWDAKDGVLYDVGVDHEQLIVRPRDTSDNAVPSGSSAAAEALLRLARLTGDDRYAETGERLLQSVAPLLTRYPLGFGNWLKVLELHLAPSTEVVLIGPRNEAMATMRRTVHGPFLPHLTVLGLLPEEERPFPSPLLEGRGAMDDQPTAYVCRNFACDLPTTSPDTLREQLRQA